MTKPLSSNGRQKDTRKKKDREIQEKFDSENDSIVDVPANLLMATPVEIFPLNLE